MAKKEVARLRKKVSTWLKEWVGLPVQISSFEESSNELVRYINGEDDSLSRVDIQTLLFWHLAHYENAAVNGGHDDLEELAITVRYVNTYICLSEVRVDAGKNGSVLMRNGAFYFSLAVLAGWKEAVGQIGKALVKGLDTSLLDLRHTDRHCKGVLYRHFWFVLHLYEQISGDRFDIKNYSYPPDMSPYSEVLTDWKTTDLTKVHNWVCTLADFHVQETRNMVHDQIEEFDGEDVMIFPYEILCWLRLREWAGLANPDRFAHPLMQQPLAKLPSPVPLAVPEVPLLDQVIAKFRQEYPNSFL